MKNQNIFENNESSNSCEKPSVFGTIAAGVIGFLIGKNQTGRSDSGKDDNLSDPTLTSTNYVVDWKFLTNKLDENSFRRIARKLFIVSYLAKATQLNNNPVDVKNNIKLTNSLTMMVNNVPQYKYLWLKGPFFDETSDIFDTAMKSDYKDVELKGDEIYKYSINQILYEFLYKPEYSSSAIIRRLYKVGKSNYDSFSLFNPIFGLDKKYYSEFNQFEFIEEIDGMLSAYILELKDQLSSTVYKSLTDPDFQIRVAIGLNLDSNELMFKSNFKQIYAKYHSK